MQVYRIINIVTGKSYVGFSKNANHRFKRHISLAEQGVNRRLYDSMRKHGKVNFIISILDTCTTREEASNLEKYWIAELNTIMPNGYNMTTGGDGGNTLSRWSDEARKALYKRQGDSRKGMVVSAETRKKISESHKGKVMPPSQRVHMSKMMKGKLRGSQGKRTKPSWIKGKTHSAASRLKISNARMGKSWEDLWGSVYVEQRKSALRERFLADKNPNYLIFTLKHKLEILSTISRDVKLKMTDVRNMLGFSEFKVRELLREVGITNFQIAKKENKMSWPEYISTSATMLFEEGQDVTELLNVVKWEPEPEYLHADAKGLFPSFFPKTDQERIQNCHKEMINALETYTWEVTEKVEGQSSSVYYYNGEVGVCSRNLELKQGISTFWTTAEQYSLPEKLIKLGRNLVIQSEQCGPGISGNIYNFLSYHLFVFDIYGIDAGKYLAPLERRELVKQLELESAPCITSSQMLPNSTCDSLLTYADGNSMLGNAPTLREGLVFKANTDSRITFKAVSNKYLLGQK